VLKADVPVLVHKTDAGAVWLDLHTDDEVRHAFASGSVLGAMAFLPR
jgi:hypothetical protein